MPRSVGRGKKGCFLVTFFIGTKKSGREAASSCSRFIDHATYGTLCRHHEGKCRPAAYRAAVESLAGFVFLLVFVAPHTIPQRSEIKSTSSIYLWVVNVRIVLPHFTFDITRVWHGHRSRCAGVTPVCQAAMSGQAELLMIMANSNQACRKRWVGVGECARARTRECAHFCAQNVH